MSDHARLLEVIESIETSHPEWVWLAGKGLPGGPDKYVASITVTNGVGPGWICRGSGPSSHEALLKAYADAVRSLN